MASYKNSLDYTLCIGSNTTDPVEARIDGDVTTFKLPYNLTFDTVATLIYYELGTSEEKAKLFYLDDESEYVQINSQAEFNIALQICKRSGNCMHMVVSARDAKKKRISDEETISVETGSTSLDGESVVSQTMEQSQLVEAEVQTEEESNVNSMPVSLETKPEEVSTSSDIAKGIEITQETIMDLIKEEVSSQMKAKIKELISQVPNLKIEKEIDESRSSDENSDETSKEYSMISSKNLNAVLICENMLTATYKPNIKLQKYWVFRNEGNITWNENTKLVLIEETYTYNDETLLKKDGQEWGVSVERVQLPALKQGETGVVEVVHTTPPFKSCYSSTWALNHGGEEFGTRVTCKLLVTDDIGSPVDTNVLPNEKNEESNEAPIKSNESLKQKEVKNYQKTKEERHRSNTGDDMSSMLSFTMMDVGKMNYLTQDEQDQAYDLSTKKSLIKKASLNLDSYTSSSTVDKTPDVPAEPLQPNADKTELFFKEEDYVQDAKQEEDEQQEDTQKEYIVPIMEEDTTEESHAWSDDTPPPVYTEKDDENEIDAHSDDGLHSIDYNHHNLVDDFRSNDVSDFVVVLPECFDITQPLSNDKKEFNTPKESTTPVASTNTKKSESIDTVKSASLSTTLLETDQPTSNSGTKEDQAISNPIETANESSVDALDVATSVSPIPSVKEITDDESPTEKTEDLIILDEKKKDASTSLKTKDAIEGEEIATSIKKSQFIPESVLDQDKPFFLPPQSTVQLPFEQGWRRNPIPLPRTVIDECLSYPEPNREVSTEDVEQEKDGESQPMRTIDNNMMTRSTNDLISFHDADDNNGPTSFTQATQLDANDEIDDMEMDDAAYSTPPPSPHVERESVATTRDHPISPLDHMYEMGFHNIALNETLLSQCDGDVNRAVQALLYRSLADNTILPMDD